jgi:hypothetical protein
MVVVVVIIIIIINHTMFILRSIVFQRWSLETKKSFVLPLQVQVFI